MFWPYKPIDARRHVSLDWQRLDKNQRERTVRFMRALLRGEEPSHVPGPNQAAARSKPTIAADLAAVQRWKR
jgi:hypothetical protein